ncbi:uncharacterized protein ARMOST_10135 [Armillaria ostoyae]|uniref:Uncharacterized protein n=1 Tax=Armillaria ostoyae TaxID=47428 RepID=A0A284RDF8_ARMOS|nr:uncharacterized protein ARMOST_10135 [Armillaria ostoyae]
MSSRFAVIKDRRATYGLAVHPKLSRRVVHPDAGSTVAKGSIPIPTQPSIARKIDDPVEYGPDPTGGVRARLSCKWHQTGGASKEHEKSIPDLLQIPVHAFHIAGYDLQAVTGTEPFIPEKAESSIRSAQAVHVHATSPPRDLSNRVCLPNETLEKGRKLSGKYLLDETTSTKTVDAL